jgi:hypothetical protein
MTTTVSRLSFRAVSLAIAVAAGAPVSLSAVFGAAALLALPSPAVAQDAEAKVKDLNKKAVDAYENLELEEARKFLMQALEICAAEGLNRNPIKATTHLNLGVVLVGGLKQRDAGTKQFRRAIEVDPNIKVPKRLSNPEIQAAFDAAVKGEGAEDAKPPAVSSTPPPAPPPAAAASLTIAHDAIVDARGGEAITARARVSGNARFDKVILAYRADSASDFSAREMDREGDAFAAQIPESATTGGTVAYYIEARGRGGQAVARNGTPDAPHVITLAAAASAGPVADLTDAPEPDRKEEPTTPGRTWLSLGLGVGGGYAKGNPEVNPNYWDPNAGNGGEKRPIEFSNVAAAKLLHFNPEIGYFVRPDILLSVQGRIQLTTGASEVRYPTCSPNGVCQPASGAVAVLAKATKLLEKRGPLQPFVSLGVGGGYIRYLVDISSFKLEGCGGENGTNCFDTVAGGGFLVGPSVGAWVHLTGPVFLTGAASALVGLPATAVNLDLNLGLGYRM